MAQVSAGAGETGAAAGQVPTVAQELPQPSANLRIEVERFLQKVRAA